MPQCGIKDAADLHTRWQQFGKSPCKAAGSVIGTAAASIAPRLQPARIE
jgi:hypothetical protein